MLERYSVLLYEEQMVEHLLEQIMSPNTELKTEVSTCRLSHSYTFVKVSTYLSMVVARLYPTTNPCSDCFRNCGIYATGRDDRGSGRDGHFNGQGFGIGRRGRGGWCRGGHGKGGRGECSNTYENGIYISYITCYFEYEEWEAISNETRKRITEDPVRTKSLANKYIWTTSSVSAKKR